MARKPLTSAGTSKLASRTGEGEGPQVSSASETRRVTAQRVPARQPTSFRLEGSDIDRLQRLTDRVSEEAGRPISRAELLKGLLLIGDKSGPKRVLTAIKDAVFEGI